MSDTEYEAVSQASEETRTPSRLELAAELSTSTLAEDKHPDRHRIIRYWILCCAMIIILVPLLTIVLGSKLHAESFAYYNSTALGLNSSVFPGRNLILDAVLVAADPTSFTITFDWTITDEVNGTCTSTSSSPQDCTDVDIFFDPNLLILQDTNVMRNSNPPSMPLFRFNATAAANQDPYASSRTFRTNHLLFSPNIPRASLVFYPFDSYSSDIYIFAQDVEAGSPVGLQINNTRGNAVGFRTYAIDIADVEGITLGNVIDIVVILERGATVRAFCIIVTIAIWLITLVLFLLTLTSIIFGFQQKVEVLLVPVATIFAFTQLRQSMPGAPNGFGDVLDFVGILPCLAILALSAALSLGSFMLGDPTRRKEVMSMELLRREIIPAFRLPVRKMWRSMKKGVVHFGKAINLGRVMSLGRVFRFDRKSRSEQDGEK